MRTSVQSVYALYIATKVHIQAEAQLRARTQTWNKRYNKTSKGGEARGLSRGSLSSEHRAIRRQAAVHSWLHARLCVCARNRPGMGHGTRRGTLTVLPAREVSMLFSARTREWGLGDKVSLGRATASHVYMRNPRREIRAAWAHVHLYIYIHIM